MNPFGADWEVGERLRQEIEGAGFRINDRKTRMSLRRSRQTVTGLVVNAKANINQDYYRAVRAMCHSVFTTGSYHRVTAAGRETTPNLAPLEGMLSHVYFVKARRDRTYKVNNAARDAGEFRPPQAPVRRLLLSVDRLRPLKLRDWTYGADPIRTAVADLNGERFWIQWDLKHIDTIGLDSLQTALAPGGGLELVARLREHPVAAAPSIAGRG